MKYIRLFEDKHESYNKNMSYWLLPSDDRLEKALYKIGASYSFTLERLKSSRRYETDYIFVCYDSDRYGNSPYWGWNSFKGSIRDSFLDTCGYTFAGVIDIPKYEVEAIKYNL